MKGDFNPSRDSFSDDRLLAFALGLGDDPELQVALESSPALARRLAEMRADVATVSDRLQTSVPGADPDYADPADPRWARLHPYFAPETAPVRSAAPSRRGRLVVVAAVIAVFAVTVAVAVQRLPGGSGSEQAAETTARSADGGGPAAAPLDTKGLAEDSSAVPLPQADEFAAVCVARAGQVNKDGQRFRVVRVLKGRVDRRLVIVLGEGVDVLAAGSLQILYVHPLVAGAWQSPTPGATAGGSQPTPAPATSMYGAEKMLPAIGGYRLGNEAVLIQAVPEGIDISKLSLP